MWLALSKSFSQGFIILGAGLTQFTNSDQCGFFFPSWLQFLPVAGMNRYGEAGGRDFCRLAASKTFGGAQVNYLLAWQSLKRRRTVSVAIHVNGSCFHVSGVPAARLWSCCGESYSPGGRVVGGHQHWLYISDCIQTSQNNSVHHLETENPLISHTSNLCVSSVISLSRAACTCFLIQNFRIWHAQRINQDFIGDGGMLPGRGHVGAPDLSLPKGPCQPRPNSLF